MSHAIRFSSGDDDDELTSPEEEFSSGECDSGVLGMISESVSL